MAGTPAAGRGGGVSLSTIWTGWENQTSRFIWFSLLERQFGWFDLFVLVLGYSESESITVCLVGFLSLLERFWNFLRVSINHLDWLGKPNQPVHLVQFAGTAVWVV